MTRVFSFIVALSWFLLACGHHGSTVRDAHQIEPGLVYLDQVMAGTDDEVDWHQGDMETPARLLVQVEPDELSTAVGWIDVFDDHGSLVGTGQIKRGGSKVEIETTQSVRLFVQVRVSSGILRYKLTVTALDGESSCLGDLEVR